MAILRTEMRDAHSAQLFSVTITKERNFVKQLKLCEDV